MKFKFLNTVLMGLILSINSLSATAGIITPPVYEGNAQFDTKSHGGGYSAAHNEYWYSQWAGETVYRYDENYNLLGSFLSGQSQIMQLWGDIDGSYYTANWGYNTITKKAGMNDNSTLWSYNLGSTASGVTADSDYVYAMNYSTNQVSKLDIDTGLLVDTFGLDNIGSTTYGGLLVVDNNFFRIAHNGYVNRYDLDTGEQESYFLTGGRSQNVYNMSFNGEQVLFSSNSGTSNIYRFSDGITQDVPEPSTLAIFALGMIGLASRRFKKQS
jgi:hypothetical protein